MARIAGLELPKINGLKSVGIHLRNRASVGAQDFECDRRSSRNTYPGFTDADTNKLNTYIAQNLKVGRPSP